MKKQLGNLNALYPTPTTLVGATVNGKPNFITIAHVDEAVLTNGKVDIAKVKPLLFDMSSARYWSLGGEIAKCWRVGKQLKK